MDRIERFFTAKMDELPEQPPLEPDEELNAAPAWMG
jgi:hypothetical protein